jgi:hypothetical protein
MLLHVVCERLAGYGFCLTLQGLLGFLDISYKWKVA